MTEVEGLHLVQEPQGQNSIETLKTRRVCVGRRRKMVADGLLLNKLMRTVIELRMPPNY